MMHPAVLARFHMRAASAAVKRGAAYANAPKREARNAKVKRLHKLSFWNDTAALHLEAARGPLGGGHLHVRKKTGLGADGEPLTVVDSYLVPWPLKACKNPAGLCYE